VWVRGLFLVKVLLNKDSSLEFHGSSENMLGLLHVITGDGKGKSTASIGLSVRASGAGYKVLFIQFFKMYSSELDQMKKLGIEIKQFQHLGTVFKRYKQEEFDELKEKFKEFWDEVIKDFTKYDLIVLDEIVYVITEGLFPEKKFLEFLEQRSKKTELVLTGRNFPESIIKKADYVSEVRRIKHPYDQGVEARKGVEF